MRVRWLTVDGHGSTLRAVLHTVIHRRPRDLPVSLETAARLATSGVPLVVRGLDAPGTGNAA